MSWRDLVRAPLRGAPAYHVPSWPNAIKLDANESPFPLSRAATEALAHALAPGDLHRYPDAGAGALREVLASQLGVSGDELLFGNGSDEILSLLCAAFGQPREGQKAAKVLYPVPTFVVYRTAALGHGLEVIEVPFGPRFEANEEALLDAVARERPNVVFLATPNNPTGTVWPRSTIDKLLARDDLITVVDEAYLAYAEARTCVDLALAHPHCLVLQTLSKIGLAGLRVGYLIGRREVLAEVEKARPPYNLGTLPLRAATTLLRDFRGELEAHAAEVKRERARLAAALGAIAGVEVFPSDANFFMVRVPGASAVYERLAERGVVVRCFDRPDLPADHPLRGCLRITVGTPAENDWLRDALAAAVAA